MTRNDLNHREEQILRLIMRGKTNKDIAKEIGIAEKTVKNYMTVLLDKMGCRNRLEALLAGQVILGA